MALATGSAAASGGSHSHSDHAATEYKRKAAQSLGTWRDSWRDVCAALDDWQRSQEHPLGHNQEVSLLQCLEGRSGLC